MQTLTGTIRGEELFCRPDLSRPWRSVSKETNALQVAEKEREIESLLRLCSDLRTELGNAKSDARRVEYVVMERKREEIALKEEELEEMRKEMERLKAAEGKAKEEAEHQIRLLQAQHENAARTLQTEFRLLSDQLVEQARQNDQQLKDLKEVSEREVHLLETRFGVRVQELEAERDAMLTNTTATEKHYQALVAEGNTLYAKVDATFAEYRRNADEKRENLQDVFERSIQREREATCEAQREAREAKERLAAAAVDVEEIRHRFVLWSEWILLMLDAHHRRYADACPAHISPITDPRQHELPLLYTPRSLQQESEAKMTVERVVFRLLELEAFPIFSEDGGHGGGGGNGSEGSEGMELRRETAMAQMTERQHQLRAGIRELEDRCREMERTYSALRTRLHFFSDDLQASSALSCPQVQPPLPRKCTLVCLAVYEGNLLWATRPSEMQTAITYLHATLRCKRQEYGAYECYADGVCMLLAFEDVLAAVRFAVDVQEWCLRLPWPATLVREEASCGTVYGATLLGSNGGERRERGAGNALALGASATLMDHAEPPRVSPPPPLLLGGGGGSMAMVGAGGAPLLFHGLRIGVAIHTGQCEVEDTAVPEWRHMGVAAFTPSSFGSHPNSAVVFSAIPTHEKEGEESMKKDGAEKVAAMRADGPNPLPVASPLRAFSGVCRRHFYGRGVLQTVFIASLAQGGQVLVSDAVWKHPSLRAREAEMARLVVHRSLGRYAVLSLDPKSGLEESQTMELFQILPPSLSGRRFLPTSQLLQRADGPFISATAATLQEGVGGGLGKARSPFSLPPASPPTARNDGGVPPNGLVKGLERVKNFTIAVGIAALENQNRAIEEGMQLLQGELHQLHDKSEDMMAKARRTQSQFHLLPPPEMVVQLNELYRLLEDVAGLSEETTEDMRHVEVAQDELRTHLQGVREYLRRYLSDGERESNLKVEHEAALSQLDRLLREVQAQRQGENEQLLLAVNERDQALRHIFQQQQQQRPSPPALHAVAPPPSLAGSANVPTQMLASEMGSARK